MASPIPRVFTIPASVPFLPTLIEALLGGRLVAGFPAGPDPLALAGATLYLPTRRACRLARDVFLDIVGGDAAILPRIVSIGDVDEDEIAFAEAATGDVAAAALDLPEALGGFARNTLLDGLIEAERARLAGSAGPVIAAGSTGSMPATAMLLDTIAKLPHGAVVLPGLDTDLDAAAWELIGGETDAAPGHPQFAMQALLRR